MEEKSSRLRSPSHQEPADSRQPHRPHSPLTPHCLPACLWLMNDQISMETGATLGIPPSDLQALEAWRTRQGRDHGLDGKGEELGPHQSAVPPPLARVMGG